jgi:adenylate cyclase
MKRLPSSVILVAALATLAVYLFASAPPPLPEAGARVGRTIPINDVLTLISAENDIARALYTNDIVGAGKKVGIAFDEKWREPDVQAGPLPALFLRESAMSLQKRHARLGLFLGSDFPIASSNLFHGKQNEVFQKIRQTQKPEFFYAEDTQLYTAMFPDYASVQGCVDCHNLHADSPKKDWKLNDMMGATTWSYPSKEVTYEEAVQILGAVRKGFQDAYEGFLAKTRTFSKPPEIGDRWPKDGYYLPSSEVFLAEFSRRSSGGTVQRLLALSQAAEGQGASELEAR